MSYKKLFSLENKVAIVSGGAGGIGQKIVEGLVEFGAKVVVADIKEARSSEVEFIKTDVTNSKSVKSMVEEVKSKYGRIDILINCAGVNKRVPVIEFPEEEWDRIMDINLKGTFLMCKEVGKVMVDQKYGRIVNFGSVSSVLGHPNHSAYAASKGGVLLFTKVFAMEMAKNNVTVNCIGPAYIETPLTFAHLREGDNYKKIVSTIPMGRLGKPEDVVGAVIYLASDAAAFTTGSLLLVDGGRTAD
ncbi:MAG: hypothetical protein PWP21_1265 [Thermosediminibacterales bacterium]|nr:hypothetical protein [Thermosediminibacterales bacterium]